MTKTEASKSAARSDELVQGYTAKKNGYARSECPFKPFYVAQRRDWLKGWGMAAARLAATGSAQ